MTGIRYDALLDLCSAARVIGESGGDTKRLDAAPDVFGTLNPIVWVRSRTAS